MSRVTLESQGQVLTIRLNRPSRRNALDLQLARELVAALSLATDFRAVALMSTGEHFCVGGDLSGIRTAADPVAYITDLVGEFHRAVRLIRLGPPVVVGVRGWAAGAGMSTVLASDITVGSTSAVFRTAYTGIGLTPDGGLSWTLPRAVGERRARRMLLMNEAVQAEDALKLGMLDFVVDDHLLEEKTLQIACDLARGPRAAFMSVKALVDNAAYSALDDQLDQEQRLLANRIGSAEGSEGVQAFLAHRKPDFRRVEPPASASD